MVSYIVKVSVLLLIKYVLILVVVDDGLVLMKELIYVNRNTGLNP